MALRRIMEKYTANTRFCIIANYTHKLSPALLSRCTRFRFSPLKEADIRVLVDKVIIDEEVRIEPEAVDSLVRLSKGDMRRALNVLQACHATSTYPLIPIPMFRREMKKENANSARKANRYLSKMVPRRRLHWNQKLLPTKPSTPASQPHTQTTLRVSCQHSLTRQT